MSRLAKRTYLRLPTGPAAMATLGPHGSVRHKGMLASLKDSVETINKKTGEALAGGIERTQDAARRLTGRAKASGPTTTTKDAVDRAADTAAKATKVAAGQRSADDSSGSGTAGGRKTS